MSITEANESQGALETQVEGAAQEGQSQEVTQPNAEEILAQIAEEAGWKPEAEWKGAKDKWVPAHEYLRTTTQKFREAQDRIKEGQNRLRSRERDLTSEFQTRLDRMERLNQNLMTDREQELRANIKAEYESKKFNAAKEGNQEQYSKLVQEQAQAELKLDERFAPEPQVNVQQIAEQILNDPISGEFYRRNAWLVEDEEAFDYAASIADEAAKAKKTKFEQVALVEQALKWRFPERFQNAGFEPELEPTNRHVDRGEDGKFVTQRDAPFLAVNRQQQQQRRPAPNVQQGSRVAQRSADPEQAALAALPQEARDVFQKQKASGQFKGDAQRFKAIYFGEDGNVLK